MIALQLAIAFLRRRWGQALLSVLVGALGIAAVETMLIASREIPAAAQRAFGGVDIVIGPKGAALDLVLCCALHVAEPRGLVPLDAAMRVARHPLVRTAAPLGLGDNIRGIRIAGTTSEIFSIYGARIAQGRIWDKPLEAVLGAEAARQLGLKVNDRFAGGHGMDETGDAHEEFPYTVTGILAPTGSALDRLVLTDMESIFAIHRHEEEEAEEPHGASAILIALRNPAGQALLPRLINEDSQFTAASPILETARLVRAGRPVILAVIALGTIFAAIAAATAATALLAGMNARARDLALLRALGAHPWEIGVIALIEAVLLAFAAVTLGLLFAYGLLEIGSAVLAERGGLLMEPSPALSDMLWLSGGALVAAMLAAVAPAFRAARAPIETVLNA